MVVCPHTSCDSPESKLVLALFGFDCWEWIWVRTLDSALSIQQGFLSSYIISFLTVVARHRVQSLLYLNSILPILTSPTQLSSAQASRSAPSITMFGRNDFCVTSCAIFPGSRDLY